MVWDFPVMTSLSVYKYYYIGINLGFWETAHLLLPSLRAKCWVRGGVGGQFPRNLNWYLYCINYYDQARNKYCFWDLWSRNNVVLSTSNLFYYRNNNYYFTVSPTNNIYWFSVWQKTKCVLKNSPAMEKNRGKCNLLLDFQLNISQPWSPWIIDLVEYIIFAKRKYWN